MGIEYRRYKLYPYDPWSKIDKKIIGFSATIEADYNINHNFGIMANSRYTSNIKEFWAQIKPYYKFDNQIKTGGDFSTNSGKEYDIISFGAFLSDFKLKLQYVNEIYINTSVGTQYNIIDKTIQPYGTIGVASFF